MISLNLSTIGHILKRTKELKSIPSDCEKNAGKPLVTVSDEAADVSTSREDRKKAFSITQMIPPNPLLKK